MRRPLCQVSLKFLKNPLLAGDIGRITLANAGKICRSKSDQVCTLLIVEIDIGGLHKLLDAFIEDSRIMTITYTRDIG